MFIYFLVVAQIIVCGYTLEPPRRVNESLTQSDNSILTSGLFPESFPYSVYRKDRTLNGGGVMLLVHKDIPHMPLTELDNDASESVWVKLFVNKKTH